MTKEKVNAFVKYTHIVYFTKTFFNPWAWAKSVFSNSPFYWKLKVVRCFICPLESFML